MSLWNRVQYPEKSDTHRAFISTVIIVVGFGVMALVVSSTMNLLVGL